MSKKAVSKWLGVRANWNLHLSVKAKKPAENQFVAAAVILPDKGTPSTIADHELDPGPHITTTKKSVTYVFRVSADFIGANPVIAVVTAQLLDDAGKPRPNTDGEATYSFELSGKAGESALCALVLAAHA